MDNQNARAFAPYRLVAAFADGSRLLFDGLTEAQAYDKIVAAAELHGDVAWYDGVTDQHYENGRYYQLVPESGLHLTHIDLTEYDGPVDENGLPPSLTGKPPQE